MPRNQTSEIPPEAQRLIIQAIQDDYGRVKDGWLSEEGERLHDHPDALNEQGESLLTRIVLHYDQLPAHFPVGAIGYLVSNGATLLGGDTPLLHMLRMGGDKGDLIRDAVLERMALDGRENPLYLMCKHTPRKILPYMLDVQPDQEDRALHVQQWMREQDSEGHTPAHYLWGPDTTLTSHCRKIETLHGHYAQKVFTDLWSSTLNASWDVQQKMFEVGAPMDIPDHNGVSALDLCIERVNSQEAILKPGIPICELISSELYRRELHAETLTIPSGTRSLRL